MNLTLDITKQEFALLSKLTRSKKSFICYDLDNNKQVVNYKLTDNIFDPRNLFFEHYCHLDNVRKKIYRIDLRNL